MITVQREGHCYFVLAGGSNTSYMELSSSHLDYYTTDSRLDYYTTAAGSHLDYYTTYSHLDYMTTSNSNLDYYHSLIYSAGTTVYL